MKTILLFILCFGVFAQESEQGDSFIKLGLDDNGDLVRVLTEDPLRFQKVEASDGKNRMILKLLAEQIKDKNVMSIACTVFSKKSEGTLIIDDLRICSKVKNNELLYKDFDMTAKDTEMELKIVGQVLNKELNPYSLNKHVDDSERAFQKRSQERSSFFNERESGSKTIQK
jgi:hypothetical protein